MNAVKRNKSTKTNQYWDQTDTAIYTWRQQDAHTHTHTHTHTQKLAIKRQNSETELE